MKKIRKILLTILCSLLFIVMIPACSSNISDDQEKDTENINEIEVIDEDDLDNSDEVITDDATNNDTNNTSKKSPKDKSNSESDSLTSGKTKPTKQKEGNKTTSNTNVEEDNKDTTTNDTNIEIIIEDNYVEFGSYPQKEIVKEASDSGVYGKAFEQEGDYIIDASLYNTLSNLSEDKWNANGDTTIDGNKYRRINADDTTYSTSNDANHYEWSDSNTYHYFKYEPIKWKVLESNDEGIFLMSDIVLDAQMYNTNITNLTWETSTIRSWLNGYDASNNDYGTDYSSNNFIDIAFNDSEQSKILTTTIENQDNIKNGTEGGNDTNDKIYLLSEEETYGDTATKYGFINDYDTHDAALETTSSTYAKAMGVYTDLESESLGNCFWWLRSPGAYTGLFVLVRCNGSVYRGGQHANSKTRGVRPVLWISK